MGRFEDELEAARQDTAAQAAAVDAAAAAMGQRHAEAAARKADLEKDFQRAIQALAATPPPTLEQLCGEKARERLPDLTLVRWNEWLSRPQEWPYSAMPDPVTSVVRFPPFPEPVKLRAKSLGFAPDARKRSVPREGKRTRGGRERYRSVQSERSLGEGKWTETSTWYDRAALERYRTESPMVAGWVVQLGKSWLKGGDPGSADGYTHFRLGVEPSGTWRLDQSVLGSGGEFDLSGYEEIVRDYDPGTRGSSGHTVVDVVDASVIIDRAIVTIAKFLA
jgi:hypothetical protein